MAKMRLKKTIASTLEDLDLDYKKPDAKTLEPPSVGRSFLDGYRIGNEDDWVSMESVGYAVSAVKTDAPYIHAELALCDGSNTSRINFSLFDADDEAIDNELYRLSVLESEVSEFAEKFRKAVDVYKMLRKMKE
jgi:hypothetical protein